MTVQSRILEILANPTTALVRFQHGSININGDSFSFVAGEIRGGRISIATNQALPNNARAVYRRGDSQLAFATGVTEGTLQNSSSEQSLVVHEAVHAFIHKRHRGQVTRLNDEAYGFLAHTIYRMSREPTFAEWAAAARVYDQDARIFHAAAQVVQRRNLLTRFGTLNTADVSGIVSAISSHTVYRNAS